MAIGKLTVRSALMSTFFPALAAALAVMIAISPSLTFFAFGEEARIVRDAGASMLRLAALVLALALGIARAPDRAAMGLLLVRPLTPSGAIVGRYLGALVATLALLTMLSVVLYGTLTSLPAGDSEAPGLLAGRALAVAALEGAVYLAAASALAVLLPRGLAALALIFIFALAHGAERLALLLPGDHGLAAAALAATGYVALGAAVAEAREPGV